MRAVVCLAFAATLFLPLGAGAQMQPHRAEYTLRLGPAANAPKIGTAVQDVTLDCAGWTLKRDITTEISVTASWKLSLASKLEGEESRSGGAFRYRTLQIQNGVERETAAASIAPAAKPAPRSSPQRPRNSSCRGPPDAGRRHRLPDRAPAGGAAFGADLRPRVISDASGRCHGTQCDPRRPPGRPARHLPAGKSWPVSMTFTRGRNQEQRPLFSVSALIFDSGVLDRLTVETGLVTVTADLQSLQMHKPPVCPRS